MASLGKRVDDLENSVMIMGQDGRVQSGTPELIGKTSEELDLLWSEVGGWCVL